MVIKGSTGLSKDEIEKMTKEAEMHAAEDEAKKKTIEVKNQAENLIYTSEKTLKDAGDKVKAEDKKEVEEKVAALKEALKSDQTTEIESKTTALSEALQKVGAAMYQSNQSQPGQGAAPGEEAKTEEPSSAEASAGRPKKEEKVEEGEVVS